MVCPAAEVSVRSIGEGNSSVKNMERPTRVIVHFNSSHSFNFATAPSGKEIKERLFLAENIPVVMILLRINGLIIGDKDIVSTKGVAVIFVCATIKGGLAGGKGGFGAMLRALAKQSGTKKTTDFGACRDLSGRRLRHVNDDLILQKWKEAKDRGDDFDVEEETPTGIELWYLGTPSWADGIKTDHRKKFMKPRRKTRICIDWVNARKDRKVPEGAPAHYGCPRGRRCEFAHGDEELRGEAAVSKEEEKQDIINTAANKKRDAYTAALAMQEEADSLSNMVLQGMRAQKKARVEKDNVPKKNVPQVVLPILPIDGMDFFPEENVPASVTETDTEAMHSKATVEPIEIAQSVQTAEDKASAPVSQAVSKPVMGVKSSPGWVKTMSGELVLTSEGEVESESEFATAAVCCRIATGKWYYEVELLTAGLMQIGWADHLFRTGVAAEEGSEDGVGDDDHSWAYDGLRGKKWNKSDSSYGLKSSSSSSGRPVNDSSSSSSGSSSGGSENKSEAENKKVSIDAAVESGSSDSGMGPGADGVDSWRVGDVVGCLLEISEDRKASVSFTLNGVSLGLAFSDISSLSSAQVSSSSDKKEGKKTKGTVGSEGKDVAYFYPALSLEEGEAVLLNIGQRAFSFPPAADINVPDTSDAEKIEIVKKVDGVVEADVVENERKAPVKKVKMTKKEIAAEKAAEKKAEKEAEKAEKSCQKQAGTPLVSATPLPPASLLPLASYLAVIEALEMSVRCLVPLEGKETAAAAVTAAASSQSTTATAADSSSDRGEASASEIVAAQSLKVESTKGKASSAAAPSAPSALTTAPSGPSSAPPSAPSGPVSYPPVALEQDDYAAPSLENLTVLGLLHLKAELERRGLKAGGSLEDRAQRLFSVRGLSDKEIPKKLKK